MNKFPERLYRVAEELYIEVPSTKQARAFTDSLLNLLFPLRDNSRGRSLKEIDLHWEVLQKEFKRIISPLCHEDACIDELAMEFFGSIPSIFEELLLDAQMYDDHDPAAYSTEEVILCYPGFYAVMIYRIAHVLYELEVPILPRVISEYGHSQTGIDINAGATIGRGFYIDHGTGIVIGETCIIGDNVKIYQGVTLGATFVDKKLQGKRRHPRIEDNVIIYAGSTILGGDTVIGHDTVIGGNVWLTESVPPFSRVYHRPEVVIKESNGGV